MNLPERKISSHWIIFAATFCLILVWGTKPAMAFQPQPEPPGIFMPTLTPDDALRVNIAYINTINLRSARCLILYRSLLTGDVLIRKQAKLEPGGGMSMDVRFEELSRSGIDGIFDNNGDIPLRMQVQSNRRNKIFVGYEIHDAAITETRTYISGGAEPIDDSSVAE